MAEDHGQKNAQAWYENIREMVEKLRAARETDDTGALESIEQEIHESVLSVEVRSNWHTPGSEDTYADQYRILLSTGGPACQLFGELDGHGGAKDVELQYQDWGTPWTRLIPERLAKDEKFHDILMEFAGCFYFGE